MAPKAETNNKEIQQATTNLCLAIGLHQLQKEADVVTRLQAVPQGQVEHCEELWQCLVAQKPQTFEDVPE